MATAQSLMDKALGALQVLQEGEAAAGNKQTLALSLLNGMIDRWAAERLSIPQMSTVAVTLTIGTASYNVGSAQPINITPPLRILPSSYIRWNSRDTPVGVITRDEYAAIGDKAIRGFPQRLYYDNQRPTPALYVWPVPDQAYSLNLDYWGALGIFATATTDISLPPAAESALWQNLAVELWPFYPNSAVYAQISRMAMLSRSALQRTNVGVPVLERTFGEM